jgi:sulfide:quinone oxidoreductase
MKKVSDNYYVSSQISEKDLDSLKNEGFSLVVCNRPNGEEENQIDFELIQKRCESIGLTFINLPMIPGDLQSELILETKKILDKNQKTLAYCRTGTRCINLWACANVFKEKVDETIKMGTEAGYDLDHLRPMLDAIHSNSS